VTFQGSAQHVIAIKWNRMKTLMRFCRLLRSPDIPGFDRWLDPFSRELPFSGLGLLFR
jgi:hypothetical protein